MDAELNECHATVVELLISLFDSSEDALERCNTVLHAGDDTNRNAAACRRVNLLDDRDQCWVGHSCIHLECAIGTTSDARERGGHFRPQLWFESPLERWKR